MKEDDDLANNIKEYLSDCPFEVGTSIVPSCGRSLTVVRSRTRPATRKSS
jgi:hypothetical protein